ncbi:hypothetical protein Tco_0784585, partial [Tanacetum coccineum]
LRKKYRLNLKNDMPHRDKIDDPNITMEEYIRLEEEKAQNVRKCLTGKLLSMNIVYESDDEDYTVVFDKNSFSYKIISTNDLKTDSENDNEKVNMPLSPLPEPSVSCINDFDFFKDFENEFVYNDVLTSKLDFSTEPTLCPQHIDKFDFKDETSLSEYDEEEQNVLYFNDLFPFNIIYPDDLKLDKDNNDNEIDMIQSLRGNENTQWSNKLLEASHDKINKVFSMKSFVMELNVNIVAWNYLVNGMLFNLIKNLYVSFDIPFDPKRYYKDGVHTRMLRRPRYGTFTIMMRMEHRDGDGVMVFTSQAWSRVFKTKGPLLGGSTRRISWREFILALGLHTREEMESPGFARYWSESERMIPGKGGLRDYWRDISTDGDFLERPPSYTLIRDPMLRLCHRMMAHSIAGRSQALEKVTVTDLFYLRGQDVGSVNIPYLLAQYLRRFVVERKSEALISGGQFVARLAEHFGLLIEERLQGLTVTTPTLPIIDMTELVRLQICVEFRDTWAWVPTGPAK